MRGSIPTNEARVLLARDIHDGIAQDLVAVGYRLDSLLARPDIDGELRSELRGLRLSISDTLAQVRRDLFDLRTRSDQSLANNLTALYNELCKGFRGSCEIEECNLPLEDEDLLVSAARELLRNAVRHSNADSIWLSLASTADNVALTVADNGRGGATTKPGHFGLVGIEEKVAERGGNVKISGKHGSAISVSLPLFRYESSNR